MERSQVELLLTAANLKDEERTGWDLRGIREPESVADHSWGTALLCLLNAEDADVDPGEAVQMALVHDLPEAVTGDLLTGDEEKEKREREAIEFAQDAERAKELWKEYADRETRVARFVKDMDLCDMSLQALMYAKENRASKESLVEFLDSTEKRLETETGKNLLQEIREKFRNLD